MLCFFCSFAALWVVLATTAAIATHDTLHVAELLNHTRHVAVHGRSKTVAEKWTMRIMHRDLLHNSTAGLSYKERLQHLLARDARRVLRLSKLAAVGNEGLDSKAAEFGSEVVSGLTMGSGEYVAEVGVGTPVRYQYMVIDSGSDVSWLQCLPCRRCYPQSGLIFDPATSASFSTVACASPLCQELSGGRCGSGGTCAYKVAYADGSRTAGLFATEHLRFGTTTVQNVALGCGQDNSGLFVGAGGLLGLGAGQLSFPNQLGGQTAGVFSYCLADRDGTSGGSLVFGPVAINGAVTARLLRNPALPSFYFVSLAGIIVGGEAISVPEYAAGGCAIVDSGTAVTRLAAPAYVALRTAFSAYTSALQSAAGVSVFDTCYNLVGVQAVSVPSVGFYFSNGATLMLPARNYMVPVDSLGTFCLAFAPTASGLSIIGNLQQQHIRVSFDSANSVISFAPNQC